MGDDRLVLWSWKTTEGLYQRNCSNHNVDRQLEVCILSVNVHLQTNTQLLLYI